MIVEEIKIKEVLEGTKSPSLENVRDVLAKAREKKGLGLDDVGILLNSDAARVKDELFQTAARVKDEIYGERLVFFAPLYISDYCLNDCATAISIVLMLDWSVKGLALRRLRSRPGF